MDLIQLIYVLLAILAGDEEAYYGNNATIFVEPTAKNINNTLTDSPIVITNPCGSGPCEDKSLSDVLGEVDIENEMFHFYPKRIGINIKLLSGEKKGAPNVPLTKPDIQIISETVLAIEICITFLITVIIPIIPNFDEMFPVDDLA